MGGFKTWRKSTEHIYKSGRNSTIFITQIPAVGAAQTCPQNEPTLHYFSVILFVKF